MTVLWYLFFIYVAGVIATFSFILGNEIGLKREVQFWNTLLAVVLFWPVILYNVVVYPEETIDSQR